MKERRVKLVRIEEEELLEAFTRESAPHYVSIRNRQLPDGYKVEGVHHDWMSRCFRVMVSHPSFDEVPEGQSVPDLEGQYHWTAETIKVNQDAATIGVDLVQPGGDFSVKFREFI